MTFLIELEAPRRDSQRKLNLIRPILGLGGDEANYQGPAYRQDGIS